MKDLMGDLNLYKVFYVVAKSSTFSSAAKKLYITQPAISYSIKTLEKQLGCKLFCRNTKNVTLTFEGNQILNQVETAFNLILSAEIKLNDIANLNSGNISIGTPSHIGSAYVLPIIKKFHENNPNISFEIINKSTNEILKSLVNKNIEIMIDTTPIEFPNNSHHIVLKNLNLCFATSPNLYIDKVFSKIDIANSRLILPPKNSNIMNSVNNIFYNEEIKLSPLVDVTTTEMIKLFVLKDMGIGLFIKETILEELKTNSLKEIKIDFELPTIDLCLVYYPAEISLASKEFIDNYLLKDKKHD